MTTSPRGFAWCIDFCDAQLAALMYDGSRLIHIRTIRLPDDWRAHDDAPVSVCTRGSNACGDFGAAKRNQTADLGSYTALVTGGRMKIGFQTALKLLRCHAGVIVTSRFPRDAATRFSRQPDFNEWQERLQIYGLDMRAIADVNSFIDYCLHTIAELDVLVNNAAQTVRKPPAFYPAYPHP